MHSEKSKIFGLPIFNLIIKFIFIINIYEFLLKIWY